MQYNQKNLPLRPQKILKKSLGGLYRSLFMSVWFGFSVAILSRAGKPQGSLGVLVWTRVLPAAIIVFALQLAVRLGYEYLYYQWYAYEFDDEGAQITKGVISRATGHVRYERLQNIYVDQDVLDRVFGLYDVHYETAGETSGFYSHVDGLDQADADALTAYLNARIKNVPVESQTAVDTGTAEPVASVSSASTEVNTATLSSKDHPLSASIIWIQALSSTIVLTIIATFSSVFLMGVLKSFFYLNPGQIVFLYVLLLGWIFISSVAYSWVWYKNFSFTFGPERGEISTKVIGTSVSHFYYDRIQDVSVSQGVIERFCGLATVSIETAGESGDSAISGLPQQSAEQVKDFLLEKAKRFHRAGV